jgi:hypothetical protein
MGRKMETADGRRGGIPPYIPFRTFKTHVADLKEHGVPGRIDTDVLKKMPGSTARQLKAGLRFLGLTDADDHPTDDLRKLVHAYGTDQWTGALAGLLGARYGEFLSGINLAHATPSQFREHFRAAYKPADETARKSESFFPQAAQEAGIEISKRIPVITRQRTGNSAGRRRPAATKADAETKSRTPNVAAPDDDNAGAEQLDPLLIQMLRRIPPQRDGWPPEQRLRWFKAFAINVSEVYDDPKKPVDLDIKLAATSDPWRTYQPAEGTRTSAESNDPRK